MPWILGVGAPAPAPPRGVGPRGEVEKIQDAGGEAGCGATVLVLPGTYVEHVVGTRSVNIIGDGGPAATEWRGSERMLRLFLLDQPGQRVRIEGIDFSGEGTEETPLWGAVYVRAFDDGGTFEIRNCWIHDVGDMSLGATYGALYGHADTLRVANVSLWGNVGWGYGGGAFLLGKQHLEIRNNWIADNSMSDQDGWVAAGLAVYTNGEAIIQTNVFLNNGHQEQHEFTIGGGLGATNGATGYYRIIGNYFEGNEAFEGAACGGLPEKPALVSDNVFVRNHARTNTVDDYSARGGAFVVGFTYNATITHNLFLGNSAETAPGAEADPARGSAILLDGPGSYVGSNIFTEQEGAPAVWASYRTQTVVGNLVWQNQDGDYGGAPIDVQLEVAADPRFFAADLGDYRLRPDSPCIDAGDPDPPEGIDSLDVDGTRRDIGPLPFDQSDFNLLYVVPHSARAYAGSELPFRVLVANLAPQPRAPELGIELRDAGGTTLYRRARPFHFPAEGSWHDEVLVEVPEQLAPGRYTVLISMEQSDSEEIELVITEPPARPEPGVAEP